MSADSNVVPIRGARIYLTPQQADEREQLLRHALQLADGVLAMDELITCRRENQRLVNVPRTDFALLVRMARIVKGQQT